MTSRRANESMSKSEQMARVRSRDTDAELVLRHALWRAGIRYRTTVRALPGTPDLAFGPTQTALFIDGCFWHGCPAHYTEPKANKVFWQEKLRRNRERDRKVDGLLGAIGWLSVRLWEHEVYDDLEESVQKIAKVLKRRSMT